MSARINLGQLALSALRQLSRPAARFCLKHGLKYQEFVDVAKTAFIDEAQRALNECGSPVNTSRLSALTGLQRKDIAKFLTQTGSPLTMTNLLTRIVGQWQNDSRFSEKVGKPRTLQCDGSESEFAKLVSALSTDLSPYTVLFELERLGLVKREGNSVMLVSDVFVPDRKQVEEGMSLMAQDCVDLMACVESNLFSQESVPNLHIKTQYDNICIESLPQIREWLLDKGAELHEASRNFLSKFDKDLNPRLHNKSGGARVCIGTFSLIEANLRTLSRHTEQERV